MKLLLPTGLVAACMLLFSIFTIRCIDHEMIFDGAIHFFLGSVALVILFIFLYKGIQAYRIHRKWFAFIPAIAGIVIGIGLLVTLYCLKQRDRSPVRLSCVTKIVDFNGAALDFRQDGTYKFVSWSLGADYYRGTYTLQDSIITMDRSAIEKVIESNRLVIRTDGEREANGTTGRSIYQIDHKGQVITGAIAFRVK